LTAVVVGSAAGQLPLGRARQLLTAPYLDRVPGGLLAAFLTLAVAGVVVAVLLFSRLVPGSGWGIPALGAIASMGALASMYGGLYSSAVNNPIPIFDWVFYALPVALAGLPAGRVGADPVVLGLLAAVPVAALNTLGWAVSAGSGGALFMAATSGGLGVLIGLGVGVVLASVGRRPAHS